MRSLPVMLLSLSILAMAFVGDRAITVAKAESQRWAQVVEGLGHHTNRIVLVHILASPQEVRP